LGEIRSYSALEAEVLRQVGEPLTRGIEEVVPLSAPDMPRCHVLLLFARHLIVAEIKSASASSVKDQRFIAGAGRSSRDLGGAAGSSSKGVENQLFEAFDESAQSLISHLAKPMNTVVYGVQDFGSGYKASGGLLAYNEAAKAVPEQTGVPEVTDHARQVLFSELRAVSMSGDNALHLTHVSGKVWAITLQKAPLSDPVREALAAGLESALEEPDANSGAQGGSGRAAKWAELHAALREHRHSREGRYRRKRRKTYGDAGKKIIEVFEVERRLVATNQWMTPYLPTDRELGWRWMNAAYYKHPKIRTELTREQAASMKEPPVDLGALFTGKGSWEIDIQPGFTDERGWRYSLAWNASTWQAEPGFFDAIRRRRWTRTYT